MPRVHALLAAAALLFGHSAEHRPLTATRVGNGPVKVLVVGSIHGNETAGRAVLRRLRRARRRRASSCGWCDSVNPDGVRRGTRQNARGVDLNRNFARRWRGGGRAFDTYFPGRRAFSEPESRAVRRLVRRIRPAVTVYYHQHLRLVNLSAGADERDRARLRPPRRAAGADPAELPRHRDELAEPHVPGHERVRGRAAGRPALAGVGAPARRRGARTPAAAGRSAAAAAPPAHRLAQDPLRRRPAAPRCAPTRAATTASTAPRCATRR